jgi:hypothetical protein
MLLCANCAQKENQGRKTARAVSIVCVSFASIFALLSLCGGIISAVFLTLSIMFFAAFFIFRRKSFVDMPPASDSDSGYMLYQEATAPHSVYINGSYPLPDYDLRGNPLTDSADVLLLGFDTQYNGEDAQSGIDMVNINDQVWIRHDNKNKTDCPVFAESRFGWFVGCLPDTERYKKLNKQITEILDDPLYGSVGAFVSEKFVDDDGYAKLQIHIALYNTPTTIKSKSSSAK